MVTVDHLYVIKNIPKMERLFKVEILLKQPFFQKSYCIKSFTFGNAILIKFVSVEIIS